MLSHPPLDPSPQHVAIIMDGNGRWARQRGKPRLFGHRAGTENIRRIVHACVENNVKYLTVYAFSTENWSRPSGEVQGLMRILAEVIRKRRPNWIAKVCRYATWATWRTCRWLCRRRSATRWRPPSDNDRLILSVCFNYGGRDDIVRAIERSWPPA